MSEPEQKFPIFWPVGDPALLSLALDDFLSKVVVTLAQTIVPPGNLLYDLGTSSFDLDF